MVKDKIREVICVNLTDYLKDDAIGHTVDGNRCKYSFAVQEFGVEICYDFIDNFYTVKLENRYNNILNGVMLLSKSREFKKAVMKTLKTHKLKDNSWESHMCAVVLLIKQELDEKKNLLGFDRFDNADCGFDGIFI